MATMDKMDTMDKHDFNALVALAMAQGGRAAMKPVVEKEILYYDIFHALDKDIQNATSF